jgi:hypothetical protein
MKPLKKVRKDFKQREKSLQSAHTLKEAMLRIAELEAQTQAIKKLEGATSSLVITPRESTDTSEAVAVAVATDWHVGATVRPEQVSGLNTYNVAIAKHRIANFFERVVRMTQKERQDIKIEELVLFLGGDLIDGALHLDTIMTNEIAEPIRQAVLCQELIEAGLNFLQNHGEFKKITVVCADGN